MDPLFDEDWLHEHNLDILFDLFEEEIESKDIDANNGSSTIFGTSPVTSYLFGTSPPLASALDLYDLLYFDNQQSSNNSTQQQPQQTTTITTTTTSTTTTTTTTTTINCNISTSTINSTVNNSQPSKLDSTHNNINSTNNNNNNNINNINIKCSNYGGMQQVSQNHVTTTHLASPITNAMRIKRGLKKGQSEGVSLLARPLAGSSVQNGGGSCYNISNIINKNISDKTSAKITNFKKSIMGNDDNRNNSRDTDISHGRELHRYHHYITGCAVIREHAYAVRAIL